MKTGLVRDNKILDLERSRIDSQAGLAANLTTIEEKINLLLGRNNIDAGQLSGIGLAFPGLADPKSKKILSTNKKYDDALAIDLNTWVFEKWHTAFYIENDARMAAVGEWKYGAGVGFDNVVVVTIGTGIGTAAIIEGRLLRGKHFQAGILGGHFSLNYKGKKCTCGNIGCAEAEAATWNIEKKIKEQPEYLKSLLAKEDMLDFKSVFKAARNNDSVALSVRDECLQIWSAMVVNLIHAYDPELVIISGGILNSKDEIIPVIQQAVDEFAWCPWGKVPIMSSTLIDKAAILGVTYCLQNEL